MNGLTGRTIRIPVHFLDGRNYQAMLVRDQQDEPAALKVENVSISQEHSLAIKMRAGGGFVARFDPAGSAGASRPS